MEVIDKEKMNALVDAAMSEMDVDSRPIAHTNIEMEKSEFQIQNSAPQQTEQTQQTEHSQQRWETWQQHPKIIQAVDYLRRCCFKEEYFQEAFVAQLLKVLPLVEQEIIHRLKFNDVGIDILYKLTAKILGKSVGKLPVTDETRLIFEAAFVIIFSQCTNAARSQQFIDKAALLNRYPEFLPLDQPCASNSMSRTVADRNELELLLKFRNVMVLCQQVIPAQNHKNHLMDLVTRLAEGRGVKYIVGSGQSDKTSRRVLIYRREGNVPLVSKVSSSAGGGITSFSENSSSATSDLMNAFFQAAIAGGAVAGAGIGGGGEGEGESVGASLLRGDWSNIESNLGGSSATSGSILLTNSLASAAGTSSSSFLSGVFAPSSTAASTSGVAIKQEDATSNDNRSSGNNSKVVNIRLDKRRNKHKTFLESMTHKRHDQLTQLRCSPPSVSHMSNTTTVSTATTVQFVPGGSVEICYQGENGRVEKKLIHNVLSIEPVFSSIASLVASDDMGNSVGGDGDGVSRCDAESTAVEVEEGEVEVDSVDGDGNVVSSSEVSDDQLRCLQFPHQLQQQQQQTDIDCYYSSSCSSSSVRLCSPAFTGFGTTAAAGGFNYALNLAQALSCDSYDPLAKYTAGGGACSPEERSYLSYFKDPVSVVCCDAGSKMDHEQTPNEETLASIEVASIRQRSG